MHIYAFIAIFVPKLVAMVTPLCPLCTVELDEFPDSTNASVKPNSAWICRLQLKLWPFLWFLAYFGQNLVAMATSLRLWNQKCLLWIGRPRNPRVISNRNLVIFHTNAFICIYSYFSPKIGCHGNALLSFVYGSVTDEFPDSTNAISKPNSA